MWFMVWVLFIFSVLFCLFERVNRCLALWSAEFNVTSMIQDQPRLDFSLFRQGETVT